MKIPTGRRPAMASVVSTRDLIAIFDRLREFMDKSAGNAPTDDFYNFCRAFEGHLEDIAINLRVTSDLEDES